METKQKNLWGGRFDGRLHPDVEDFTFSFKVDIRLWQADIEATLAHAKMLTRQGLLSKEEGQKIHAGLLQVEDDFKNDKFPKAAEDVHSAIELMLFTHIGELAGKVHTGRSRNDQVATATRIFLRQELAALAQEIRELQETLLRLAEQHLHSVMPGFTHLQHGQPVTLAHHVMAYFWMLQRDRQRLKDQWPRLNQLPLGCGALAGTPLPLEREQLRLDLNFSGLCENSLDAVSDRDFIYEFLSTASLIALHLSRLSEEFILWSTPEFNFVQMSDQVTTGSSLMPQKKNPDVAELIRARTARLNGCTSGFFSVLKALPLSYNRDLQEDKHYLFDGVDTTRAIVRLSHLLLTQSEFNTSKLAQAAELGFTNATDLADYLVEKGVPFRQAHEVAGRAVRLALEKNASLKDLSLAELKQLNSNFNEDVLPRLTTEAGLSARKSRGGPAPTAVQMQIKIARDALENEARIPPL